MTLLHPVWLLLAVPLGVSLLLWRLPSRFLQGLRAVILLLTLLALAGLALRLPSRTGRDPAQAAAQAAARGITLDYRLHQRDATSDVAVARVEAPDAVGPGESFLITAWVHAPAAQEVAFELRRGDAVLAAGKRPVS